MLESNFIKMIIINFDFTLCLGTVLFSTVVFLVNFSLPLNIVSHVVGNVIIYVSGSTIIVGGGGTYFFKDGTNTIS